MATPPRSPRIQISGPSASSYDLSPLLPAQKKASVTIETLSNGTHKVTIRIDDDDPDTAQATAIALYIQTRQELEDALSSEV